MTEKTGKRLTIAGIVVFLLLMTAVTAFAGQPLIRYASSPERFREWIGGYGAFGRLIFVGIVFLQTVVAFIPGEPFEIAAGYAFGAFEGTALCVLGELIGSVSVFLFVKKFGVKAVEMFFPREKIDSLRFLRDEKKLETFTFFVFLIPGTPKDLLCYIAGLTPMRLTAWLIISSVARFPSVVTSTLGGNALGMGNHVFAVIVFAVTLAVSIVGLMSYNRITALRARRYDEEKRRARREQKRLRREKGQDKHVLRRRVRKRYRRSKSEAAQPMENSRSR